MVIQQKDALSRVHTIKQNEDVVWKNTLVE